MGGNVSLVNGHIDDEEIIDDCEDFNDFDDYEDDEEEDNDLWGFISDVIYRDIRAEAIKEFAERLKENCRVIGAPLITNRIDNLVKEMVGEDDGL